MKSFPRSVAPIYNEDNLATRLMDMAYVARKMAPAWDGARLSHEIRGVGGEHLGRVLPGKGIYVDFDLKRLGINRHIPFVFERSRFQRLLEKLRDDERGAITTYDGIINARANGKGEDVMIAKSSITTVAAFWYDTYRAAGNPPAGVYNNTTAPTVTATDRATVGAWTQYLTNPTGSDKKYLIALGWGSTSAQNFAILADQHQQAGLFRTSVTTAETVASPTNVVRTYGPGTSGTGNEIVCTVTVARTTPTTSTLTLTYTDEGGASSAPAIAMLANADPVDRCLALPDQGSPFVNLASGDIGVRQISQGQKAATADAAGGFAAQVVYPLMFIPGVAANTYIERDAPMNIDGLIELANSSLVIGCLKLYVFCNAATLGTLVASMRTCAG
jgi:hypothetical protein